MALPLSQRSAYCVVEHLRNRVVDGTRVLDDAKLDRIAAYRAEWGARD